MNEHEDFTPVFDQVGRCCGWFGRHAHAVQLGKHPDQSWGNFADQINKERNGPPMEFIYADTESKPENGRVATERLIRDGCTVLIGALLRAPTMGQARDLAAATLDKVGLGPKKISRPCI